MVDRKLNHRQPRRSRSGCNTCKTKKVKCDELHPVCGRCTRLQLDCEWPVAGPPLRERRRLQRVWRWHEDFQPAAILPKDGASPASNNSVDIIESIPSIRNTAEARSPGFDLNLSEIVQPLTSEGLPSEPNFNFPSNNGNDDGNYNGHLFGENALPNEQDLTSIAWPSFYVPDFSPSPALSTYNIPLPCSILMTRNEHQALNHYSTTFSMAFTMKHPKWSTLSMIQTVGWAQPMIMHFLMAVSLRDLYWRGEDEHLRRSAESHYRYGTQLLAEEMANHETVTTKHLSILISFWFLYLYKTRSVNVDVDFLQKLSQCTLDHVRRYKLDSVGDIAIPLVTTPGQSNSEYEANSHFLSAKEGSLIALLLTCLYYQDIKYGFYHCGGKLAKYLNTNKQRLAQVYDLGRYALVLNWADEYPMQELVDDTQNYAMLKLNNELNILVEDLNKEFAFTRYDPEQCAIFSNELNAIQIRFASVFVLADSKDRSSISSSSSSSQNRTLINTDLSVVYYHAVCIYLFRCTLQALDVETPPAVRESVDKVLSIALKMFNCGGTCSSSSSGLGKEDAVFHRMEWPLFIAGVESQDVIHQDWIRQKMGERNTKVALERVLQEQRSTGLRVGVEFMRRVFCEDTRFRRSSPLVHRQRQRHTSDASSC